MADTRVGRASAETIVAGWLGQRIDPRALALTRIGIGTAAVLTTGEVWLLLLGLDRPGVLRVPMLPGLGVPGGSGIVVFAAIWFAASLLLALGLRLCGLIVAAMAAYLIAADQQLYSNHLYLLAIMALLTAIAPSDMAWHLPRSNAVWVDSVPAWGARLLQIQLTIVYIFAAISKINPYYLSGSVIASDMLPALGGALPSWPWLAVALAYASIGAELALAIGLWLPRVRWLVVPLGLGLHGAIVATMTGGGLLGILQLVSFGLLMVAVYPLFFSRPARPRSSPAQ